MSTTLAYVVQVVTSVLGLVGAVAGSLIAANVIPGRGGAVLAGIGAGILAVERGVSAWQAERAKTAAAAVVVAARPARMV